MPINICILPEINEGEDDGLFNREYLWPAKGDRLFCTADDGERSVEFSNRNSAYIWDGYTSSGDLLIEECRRNPTVRQSLVYPILYCYRHGLELAMKWIIVMYGGLAGVGSADYLDHDLWKLWTACKKIILVGGSNDGDESEALQAVEQIVKDFHDWDKSSMSFRYLYGKNGITFELPDYPIDLDNIKKVMQAVGHFFSGADGDLDHNNSDHGYEY